MGDEDRERPHVPDRPGPVRRVLTWLIREREEVDQEGLLAGRTLRIDPPRRKRDDES
jgi:hypothetical protein